MATTILTVGALFQTRGAGSWPYSAMNTGKFHFVWTPTEANTHATWGNSSNYYALIASSDSGGIWIVDDSFDIYDQSTGGALLQVPLTWSAGATIHITVDMVAGEAIISGATTGNGTHGFSVGNGVFTNTTLGLGIYGGGGFNLPASTFSDIDDADNGSSASAAGTSTAAGTLTGAGALAGSAAGSSTASGTFTLDNALSGSTAGSSTASGSLGGVGVLAGTSAGIATASGTGELVGSISGSSSGVATAIGTLAGAGALSGSAAGTSTASGAFPTAIELGAATAEQELNAVSHGGDFTKTTPSTDVTITSVNAGTDTFTSSAHGMKNGDGPYRFTSSGTLPAGLSSGTDYYVIVTSTTEFLVATTGANAIAATAVAISDAGSGTHTLVRTVDTEATGSLFLAFVTKGIWDDAPTEGPTDNKGNSYTRIGSVHTYATYPNSRTGAYYALGAGGTDHTWSITGTDFDEITVAAIEMKGATGVQTHSHVERAIGSATITSASVTTSTATMLVAVAFGNGPTGQDHTFTPEAGWTKIPAASREADMIANGYIQVAVAYKYEPSPGTYTVDWSGIDDEGAQLYLLALQDLPQDLSGSTAGSSSAAATLAGAGVLAGSSAGAATASGTLAAEGAMSGSAASGATVAGNLTGLAPISASAAGTSSASGALAATGALSGSSAGVATASAALVGSGALSGSADGSSSASGTFALEDAMSGSSAGTSTASATITAIGSLSGTITALALAAGVLLGFGALSGSSAGTSTASATPYSEDALAGSSAGSSSASATLMGSGALSGSADGSASASAALIGAGALTGSADGTCTVAGSGTLLLFASGASTGTSSASGAIAGSVAASGSCEGIATASGTLLGAGALSGSAAGTSTAVGGGPGITASVIETRYRPSTTVRVRMRPMPFHVGDNNDIDGEFRDGHTNALVDPTTVTIVVQTETQALTDVSTTYTYGVDALLTRVSIGKYRASIPCTEAGKWEFCWKSPGPTGKATEPGYFDVVATI